jgi:hypothetical protein
LPWSGHRHTKTKPARKSESVRSCTAKEVGVRRVKTINVMRESDLLRNHWQDSWTLKADGTLYVRVKKSGRVLRIKKIIHLTPKKPLA